MPTDDNEELKEMLRRLRGRRKAEFVRPAKRKGGWKALDIKGAKSERSLQQIMDKLREERV